MFTFDPSRLDLAREFKARPFGEHSPDLQYLLNLMRSREVEGRYVLVPTVSWPECPRPAKTGWADGFTSKTPKLIFDILFRTQIFVKSN